MSLATALKAWFTITPEQRAANRLAAVHQTANTIARWTTRKKKPTRWPIEKVRNVIADHMDGVPVIYAPVTAVRHRLHAMGYTTTIIRHKRWIDCKPRLWLLVSKPS